MKTRFFGALLGALAVAACDSDSMTLQAEEQTAGSTRLDSTRQPDPVVVIPPPIDSSTCYTCTESRYYRSDTSSTLPYYQNTQLFCGADAGKAVTFKLERDNNTFTNEFFTTETITTCTKYK